NINYDREIYLMGTGGHRGAKAYVANNVSLKLPGVSAKGLQLLVMEDNFIQIDNLMDVDVHGIIGYNLFNRFVIKIDYDRSQITLYEPSSFKPRRSYTEIPLKIENTKAYLQSDILINEKKIPSARLMLDTGASHSVLLDSGSHEHVVLPSKTLPSILGWGISGPVRGHFARINKLHLKHFSFDQVISSFPQGTSYYSLVEESGRQGTLGGEILSRFVVILDYSRKKMYLKKGTRFRKKFEHNMSGMTVTESEEELGAFFVFSVRENSPADRIGIKEGDIITYVNGNKAERIKMSDFNLLLRSKSGKKINLRILRDKELVKKSFRLQRAI
ncbi:PDZ domain-containing protein, partial [Xanthovirga aplysinae]|uniref:PDZ domain-containing protein n=1 Tax=Xanthovirga aplysinae TaxID=2529853 RepID=UPI0012BC10C6